MALFKKRKTTAQKQFWTIGFTPAKNSPSRKIQTFRVQTRFSRKRRYDHWLFSQTNFPSSFHERGCMVAKNAYDL